MDVITTNKYRTTTDDDMDETTGEDILDTFCLKGKNDEILKFNFI